MPNKKQIDINVSEKAIETLKNIEDTIGAELLARAESIAKTESVIQVPTITSRHVDMARVDILKREMENIDRKIKALSDTNEMPPNYVRDILLPLYRQRAELEYIFRKEKGNKE